MTAPSKPPTASGISRLLKNAGFTRSARMGQISQTSGYKVGQDHVREDAVRVRYYAMSMQVSAETRRMRLAQYAKTLTDAGWTVEAGEYAEHRDPAELYDLLDVVQALAALQDPHCEAFAIHRVKVREMGGFQKFVEWCPVPAGKEGGDG